MKKSDKHNQKKGDSLEVLNSHETLAKGPEIWMRLVKQRSNKRLHKGWEKGFDKWYSSSHTGNLLSILPIEILYMT